MESVFRLGVIFRVVDRFSAPVRRMGALLDANRNKLRAMGADLRRWGRTALIVGGIAAAAALAPAKSYGKFEAELAAVGTMTQATATQMRQLERTAVQLGIETEHSPQAAIEAFRALSAQGLTLAQQFKAIQPTLLLATAGQIDLGTAAETTASALNAFGIEAGQAQRVVDVLMKATTISALRAGEYQMALGKLGPAAQASNQEFEDMIALMGAMRSQGITAESAAEKIRVALQVLRAPTGEAEKLIRKLGIQTRDAGGKMLPFARVVDSMQAALAGMDDAMRDQILSTIFGRDAMQAFESTAQAAFTDRSGGIHRGTDALRAMSGELRNAQGAGKAFAETFLATFEGKLQLFIGSVQTLTLVGGKFLAGVLGPLVDTGIRALNWLIAWAQAHPDAARKTAAFAVVATGLALAAGLVATGLGLVFGALVILGGPITIAIALVVGLGAAVAALVIWWDEATAAAGSFWEALQQSDVVRGLALAVGHLTAALKPLWDSLRETNAIKGLVLAWNTLADAIGRAWEALQKWPAFRGVTMAWNWLRGVQTPVPPAVDAAQRAAGQPAPQTVEDVAARSQERRARYEGFLRGMRGDTHVQAPINVTVNDRSDADYLVHRLADFFGGLVTAEQE